MNVVAFRSGWSRGSPQPARSAGAGHHAFTLGRLRPPSAGRKPTASPLSSMCMARLLGRGVKLALGLDVQTNAKGGKFMSIEDSHQGALVRKVDVEALWEPGNFQGDGAKGVCFASNTDLELWTEEVEQGVIDNTIIFQKPFPGAARTELESQLQRAVKVSAKGKHVKCKMDLERCLFWDPAGNRAPRPAEFARRRGKNSKRRIQRIILSTIFSPTATQQTENTIQNNKQTK